MKLTTYWAAVVLAIIALGTIASAEADEMTLTPDDVLRTEDGRTFYISVPDVPEPLGFNLKVQLRDVSVPDMEECWANYITASKQAYAMKSRQMLRLFLKNAETITLSNIVRSNDSFALLADVAVNGRDIREPLFLMELAVPNFDALALDWCMGTPEV